MHDLAKKGADKACNKPECDIGGAKQRARVHGIRRCRSGKASAEIGCAVRRYRGEDRKGILHTVPETMVVRADATM